MVKSKTKFVKLIMRLFKEVGMHKIFLESRKMCCRTISYDYCSNTIYGFIDRSLCWGQTDEYSNLWRDLYEESSRYCTHMYGICAEEQIKTLLEDDKEVEILKGIVKKYI